MGAYAALHFGLMYPQMARSLVVAGVGSGSPAADRAACVAEAEATARAYLEQGAAAVAEVAGRGPTRLQLQRKDPRAFEEFLSHLREHSAEGKARTILGYQARRPSLQDFENEFSRMRIPVLLIAGDEDEPCLETTLWLKKTLPNAGLWMFPDTGHAINLEEPAAFNRTVEDFLSAVRRGRWRALNRRAFPIVLSVILMASEEELKAEIERLRAENETLKKPARGQMSLKVSEKGGLSVYGLGRFPVTLYREQWEKLLANGG